jgi:DNA replication protein DnaC
MKQADEVIQETGGASSKANTPTISSTSEAAPSTGACPLCGGLGYVRENVPVGHPRFGQLFPCRCKAAEIEQQRLEQLRAVSNLDHLARMTFDTFVPEGYGLSAHKAANLRLAFDVARQYAGNPRGWLILFGGFGCGKTHLAAAIANQSVERGRPVLFVAVPDLLDYLRATFDPGSPVRYAERFEEVRNAPLLVLDDLGTQSSTAWAQEKLFQILNYRSNARLPTVITSNHSLEEIDLRIRSRMADPDLATLVTILAPDFRRSGIDRDQSDLSSLSLMHDMTFEAFDLRQDELPAEERANLERAFRLCRDYAEQPEGLLVLTGEFGCGKTHLASAIANTRAAAGHPALFIVVPDLLDHLRATFSPSSPTRYDERFEEVRNASLLVLDDLGTQSSTPWAQEKLFQILNHRYNARLPTVITMATPIDEVEPRLRTRMLDVARCTVFAILAPSYRGTLQRRAVRKSNTRRQRSQK